MIAIFLLLIAISCFGLVAAWLAENPGNVTIYWFDYRIDTSFAALVLFALMVAVVVTVCYSLFRRFVLAPERFVQKRSLKYYSQGLSEITHSVAALAASDITTAEAHTRKAEKLLGSTPLILLLSAQIAKSRGDEDKTRDLLVQLLEHKETEYLAAKSLSDAAGKQQLLPQALEFAQRAQKVNPKEAQAAWALFDLQLSLKHWQEAEQQATNAHKKGAFNRADLRKARGRLALEQAKTAFASAHRDAAAKLALQAVALLPGNEEALLLAADLSDQPHALKLIQAQWKAAPSKALAALYLNLIDDETPKTQAKLIKKLTAQNPRAEENALLTR